MKTLELTIDNKVVARIAGEALAPRSKTRARWSGFSSLELLVTPDTPQGPWLRFEVAATTTAKAPKMGQDSEDDLRSNLFFEQALPEGPSGRWEIPEIRPSLILRCFWNNPLTPGSRGLWLRLHLTRFQGQLRVKAGKDETRIWSWSAKGASWESEPVLPGFTQTWTMAELLAKLVEQVYAGSDGSECDLLTGDRPRWLVDATGLDRIHQGFHLDFLEPDAGNRRLLCARFKATSPKAFRVSGAALIGEARADLAWHRRDIDLLCAARKKGFLAEWHLAASADRELSLDTLYHGLARHYFLGLASARSRNNLTFLPTELKAEKARLHFEIDGAATRLRQILVDPQPVSWVTGGASELGAGPVVLAFAQGAQAPTLRQALDQAAPAALLQLQGAGVWQEGDGWLINGVQLLAAPTGARPLEARLTLSRAPSAERYGQDTIAADLRVLLENIALRPASDDPELGFETLSAWQERERPMVIDLESSSPPRLKLEIRELANPSQSRLLRIGVRNAENQSIDFEVDAVVLDPSPLLAARVRSNTPVDPEGLVAEFTDDSDQAPEWAFASAEGQMRVVLPPQVIGEEMIKGRLYLDGQEIPSRTEPFDFRLSPTARLDLDRTDIDTARTLAPWSLRRLLGQRPGVVGARLVRAELELLYGLLTNIDKVEGLRIGELDAFVGRIPFPDQLLDYLRATRGGTSRSALDSLRQGYAMKIAGLIRSLLYRPSYWPVFRDFSARQQLTLTGNGVRAHLRRTRDTAHPLEVDRAAASPPAEPKRLPLRGGVDWPFQSLRVYDELVAAPESTSVALEGLVFGSLGGSGKQTAAFNGGKTLIISETTQGRLDSVTVIRLGRIAMLWNRARHVIVYERTVRPAPRYRDPGAGPGQDDWERQSTDFDGLAALRKVREYIEITEPKRLYPETASTRPISGPIRASSFETIVIPVKSSWGRDLPTGFAIALRGPLEPTTEEKFFPFPKIFLEQARARGKGEGTISAQLSDPAELWFYTSTLPQDGGDSDRWAPVPDLDFPVIRPAGPAALPFRSRFSRYRQQPDARMSEFGQRRFTISLDPAEEAADLMAGRLSEGIEARIRSVSFARGALASAPLPNSLAKKAENIAEPHARLHDGLAELRLQVAQARADGATTLGDLDSFLAEARQVVAELRTDAKKLGDGLPQTVEHYSWQAEQQKWAEDFERNNHRLGASWKDQLDLADVDPGRFEKEARAALQQVCRQIHQRLDEAGWLPLKVLERLDFAQRILEREARGLEERLLHQLDVGLDQLGSRYREILGAAEEELGQIEVPALSALQEELDALFAALAAALARLEDDALQWLLGALGELFQAGAQGLVADFVATLRGLVAELRMLAEELEGSLPPLELLEPDWAGIRSGVARLLDHFRSDLIGILEDQIAELRKKAVGSSGLPEFLKAAHANLEKACNDAESALGTGAAALTAFLEKAESVLTGVRRQLEATLEDFQKVPPWSTVEGSADHLKRLRDNAEAYFDQLAQALDGALPIAEAEQALAEASRRVGDTLEGVGRQVERAVAQEIRALGNEIVGAAATLDLTRVLATGPINDTLRCTRDQLGYYYDAAKDLLPVTRASALFNELGASTLNALSVEMPFDKIRDRLLPQLQGLDLGDLLPNFGGLKLEHLFPELAAPNDSGDNEWIRVRHGFDKDRLTAFAEVEVDKVIEGTPALFVLPPLALRIARPHFLASSRLEISQDGGKVQQTRASIAGDWLLCLSEKKIVTLREATLRYDSAGGFDFDFDSEKIELAEELRFVTDAMKALLPQEEGLLLTPVMPAGVRAELSLPLPDLGAGAFTLTGVTLHTFVELLILEGFEVRTGFWLSKPNRPFGLAVAFLGGGGWIGLEASYRPPDRFVTRVSIGLSAGAFAAVNFSVASGSAGLLFTAGLDFYRDWLSESGRTLITIGVLVWGEFSILGIASASLRLSLSATYDGTTGTLDGQGSLEVSIKICWCFTLQVSQKVHQRFAGKGGGRKAKSLAAAAAPEAARFLKAVRTVHSNVAL